MRGRFTGRLIASLGFSLIGSGASAPAARLPAAPPGEMPARQTLERYLSNAEFRRRTGSESTTFKIDASLPKLKKHGIMRGLKLVSSAGPIVFTQLHFVGDELIKTAVIARFLAAETRDPARGDVDISEQNYRFHYCREASYNERKVYVFRLEPKRRRVGLVLGELWLDAETAEPLREWGELVKSPSALVSHISLVRDYTSDGAHSQPRRITVKLRAAFVGPAELTMWLDEPENEF